MHEALAAVIFMGQLFSLMPIIGYGPATDPRTVTMRFLSVRFVYGCVTLLLMLTLIMMLGAYTAHQSSFGVQQASK